ncbi:hypothetical protein VPIG_00034 [Vibrio phage PWH3a-P1]|uniref:hypothetical protein n=1 Tax=Vibrio phage PWH3a-P1 TaxID=754058 RepID=UPI0002C09B38|nr:hypothetical protein VPIG_00034 [Vibrio phage PWH3a-P1]AGH31892.1 hypothetical protein VPIG_00034 [Vibrio phage PWH3a-P1]
MTNIRKEFIHLRNKDGEDLEGLNIIVHESNDLDPIREKLFYKDIYLDHSGLKNLNKTDTLIKDFTISEYDNLNTSNNCILYNLYNTPCISKVKILFCGQYWDIEVLKGVFDIIDILLWRGLFSLRNKIESLNCLSGLQFRYVVSSNSIEVTNYHGDTIVHDIKDLDTMFY